MELILAAVRMACIQMRTGGRPADNAAVALAALERARDGGAGFVSLPEAANLLCADARRYPTEAPAEDDDPLLGAARTFARESGTIVHLGSLLLRRPDGLVANRTLVIGRDGATLAAYDKAHLFDVDLGLEEASRESATIARGDRAVVLEVDGLRLGLTICFDLRFSYLYRRLAQAGAEVLLVPANFSTVTGPAHWEPLLRARAIEMQAYVVAAAQCGTNDEGMKAHGRSMIVSPWGDVVAAAGDEPTILFADIDPAEVARVRRSIPSLAADRDLPLEIVTAA